VREKKEVGDNSKRARPSKEKNGWGALRKRINHNTTVACFFGRR